MHTVVSDLHKQCHNGSSPSSQTVTSDNKPVILERPNKHISPKYILHVPKSVAACTDLSTLYSRYAVYLYIRHYKLHGYGIKWQRWGGGGMASIQKTNGTHYNLL